MSAQAPLELRHGHLVATVLPDEGGVLVDALLDGRPLLTRTPWASTVAPSASPAATEAEWVARWRGGWQLCFPTAGQPDPAAAEPQGFHGAASQAPWLLVAHDASSAALGWADRAGLSAERVWQLSDVGDGTAAISVATRVRNEGAETRTIIAAEHLILGGDVLAGPLDISVPGGALLRPLDYDGLPAGALAPWPGDPAERWSTVTRATPARVTGLAAVGGSSASERRLELHGAHVDATVRWRGEAPHALLWEELGVSAEAPWNGEVVALGIEPTTTPHGAGTAHNEGLVRLAAGGTLEWGVTLEVRWASTAEGGGA